MDNWYEEDENCTEQEAEQIWSAVYHKLKCGGWGAGKEELESHGLTELILYSKVRRRLVITMTR